MDRKDGGRASIARRRLLRAAPVPSGACAGRAGAPPALITVLLLLLSPPAAPAWAEEIRSFHSDIDIRRDGKMEVVETVAVSDVGREIRRGIYRDFPTRYTDPFGASYRVGFDVLGATRDGAPEEYRVEPRPNGYRVYLGRKGVLLSKGPHAWTLAYVTDRQLGYFDGHDELYWNVTGNGWGFPILEASAAVRIPGGFARDGARLSCYTGPQGSREGACGAFVDGEGVARFSTTRPLRPREGLTIVAGWPKGVVREPTRGERAAGFLRDNRPAFIGLGGLVVVLGYYLSAWFAAGRDPRKGTIIPLYEPPPGFSPAQVRYLVQMGYDHKAFSAAVIDLAVKGRVRIVEEDGVYALLPGRAGTGELPPEEKRIEAAVLASGGLPLRQENHAAIRAAISGVEADLKRQCDKVYLVTNAGYFAAGVALSALALLVAGLGMEGGDVRGVGVFLGVWLTVWTFGTAMLLTRTLAAWRAARWGSGPPIGRWAAAFGSVAVFVLFLAGAGVGIYALCSLASPATGIVTAGYGLVNFLFYRLLKAPTLEGRKVIDRIEGFKMFLSVAEAERLEHLTPADRTPELFEKYLPYALALDVEQRWSELFSDVLAAAAAGGALYHPAWYAGGAWDTARAAAFTSSLGWSLAGAVSSSSASPGSSSGFGGGGGSGGGGGGGGGGGW